MPGEYFTNSFTQQAKVAQYAEIHSNNSAIAANPQKFADRYEMSKFLADRKLAGYTAADIYDKFEQVLPIVMNDKEYSPQLEEQFKQDITNYYSRNDIVSYGGDSNRLYDAPAAVGRELAQFPVSVAVGGVAFTNGVYEFLTDYQDDLIERLKEDDNYGPEYVEAINNKNEIVKQMRIYSKLQNNADEYIQDIQQKKLAIEKYDAGIRTLDENLDFDIQEYREEVNAAINVFDTYGTTYDENIAEDMKQRYVTNKRKANDMLSGFEKYHSSKIHQFFKASTNKGMKIQDVIDDYFKVSAAGETDFVVQSGALLAQIGTFIFGNKAIGKFSKSSKDLSRNIRESRMSKQLNSLEELVKQYNPDFVYNAARKQSKFRQLQNALGVISRYEVNADKLSKIKSARKQAEKFADLHASYTKRVRTISKYATSGARRGFMASIMADEGLNYYIDENQIDIHSDEYYNNAYKVAAAYGIVASFLESVALKGYTQSINSAEKAKTFLNTKLRDIDLKKMKSSKEVVSYLLKDTKNAYKYGFSAARNPNTADKVLRTVLPVLGSGTTEGLTEQTQEIFLQSLTTWYDDAIIQAPKQFTEFDNIPDMTMGELMNVYGDFIMGFIAGTATKSISMIAERSVNVLTVGVASNNVVYTPEERSAILNLYSPDYLKTAVGTPQNYATLIRYLQGDNSVDLSSILNTENIDTTTEVTINTGQVVTALPKADGKIDLVDVDTNVTVRTFDDLNSVSSFLSVNRINDNQIPQVIDVAGETAIPISSVSLNAAINKYQNDFNLPVNVRFIAGSSPVLQRGGTAARGVFDKTKGIAYINADIVNTPADIKRIINHESIGHGLLRTALGNDFQQTVNLAQQAFPSTAAEIRANYDTSKFGEELLASISENVDFREKNTLVNKIFDNIVKSFNRLFNKQEFDRQNVREILRKTLNMKRYSHDINIQRLLNNYKLNNSNVDLAVAYLAQNNKVNLENVKQIDAEQILRNKNLSISKIKQLLPYSTETSGVETLEQYLNDQLLNRETPVKNFVDMMVTMTEEQRIYYEKILKENNLDIDKTIQQEIQKDFGENPNLEYSVGVYEGTAEDQFGMFGAEAALTTVSSLLTTYNRKTNNKTKPVVENIFKGMQARKDFLKQAVELINVKDASGKITSAALDNLAQSIYNDPQLNLNINISNSDNVYMDGSTIGIRLYEQKTGRKYKLSERLSLFRSKTKQITDLYDNAMEKAGYDKNRTEPYTDEEILDLHAKVIQDNNITVTERDRQLSNRYKMLKYAKQIEFQTAFGTNFITKSFIEKTVDELNISNSETRKQFATTVYSYYNKSKTHTVTRFISTVNSATLTASWSTTLAQLQDLPIGIGLTSINLPNIKAYFSNLIKGVDNPTLAEVAGITSDDLDVDLEVSRLRDYVFNKIYKYTGLQFIGMRLVAAKIGSIESEIFNSSMSTTARQDLERFAIDILSAEEYTQFQEDVKNRKMSDVVKRVRGGYVEMYSAEAAGGKADIYNRHGFLRILYNLKSFLVPILTLYRRRVVYNIEQSIKDPDNRKRHLSYAGREVGKMLMLSLMFGWADDVTDMIKGKDPDDEDETFGDYALESALMAIGLNKYFTVTAQREGLVGALSDTVTPKLPAERILWSVPDMIGDEDYNWNKNVWGYTPLIGGLIKYRGETE